MYSPSWPTITRNHLNSFDLAKWKLPTPPKQLLILPSPDPGKHHLTICHRECPTFVSHKTFCNHKTFVHNTQCSSCLPSWYVSGFLPILRLNDFLPCGCTCFQSHSSISGNRGCFPLWSAVNAAATSVCGGRSLQILAVHPSADMHRSRIAAACSDFMFSFLRRGHTSFHSGRTISVLLVVHKDCVSSYSCPRFSLLIYFSL